MAMTETFSSFFKPRKLSSYTSCGPMTCSIVSGVLTFVALTGVASYFSFQLAAYCSTLPSIEFKTRDNVTDVIHPNRTDILDDIEDMKRFIEWFNQLEPYDFCFYTAFSAMSCFALSWSIGVCSLVALFQVEFKNKLKESPERCSFNDCTKTKIENEDEDYPYSELCHSPRSFLRRSGNSKQPLCSNSMTIN